MNYSTSFDIATLPLPSRYYPVTIYTITLLKVTVFCPTLLIVHQRYTSLHMVTHRYLNVTYRYIPLLTVIGRDNPLRHSYYSFQGPFNFLTLL